MNPMYLRGSPAQKRVKMLEKILMRTNRSQELKGIRLTIKTQLFLYLKMKSLGNQDSPLKQKEQFGGKRKRLKTAMTMKSRILTAAKTFCI